MQDEAAVNRGASSPWRLVKDDERLLGLMDYCDVSRSTCLFMFAFSRAISHAV